ncbi:ArnT family glycosyltransferase [Methylobacillus flagellatus]|uniref:ArnT family glycosyltransferase n=1 Tax=Methylobacillus flagellatus TaxID=405 RepID=UPI0014859960|nr:glycosyltransferase family 39 protein [Methylobacillus flagellatus]
MNRTLKTLMVLVVFLIAALAQGLDTRPLYKTQEVRVAETAREMLVSGEWIVPHYNGELRLQKPPLPYWMTALSFRLGGVSEAMARVPSVLFGSTVALILFLWLRRSVSLGAATNSLLVLASSFICMRYFRSGEADALLLMFVTAASVAGYHLQSGRILSAKVHHAWRLLFFVAIGLGFLTKGPAAIAMPVLTVVAFALLMRQPASLRQYLYLPGWLLLLLLAAGWYLLLLWQMPDAMQYFVQRQVDETFIRGNHAQPIWWYLGRIPEFFLPWSLLIVPAAIWLWAVRPISMPVTYALVWFAVAFVLLSLTVNKQTQYALLLAPPLAVLLGCYLDQAQGRLARFNRWFVYGFFALMVVALAYLLIKRPWLEVWTPAWVLLLLPLLAVRLLKLDSLSVPVLLVASLFAMSYVYSEDHASGESQKTEARDMAAYTAGLVPLFQTKPGDGALSYYAIKVIPPLDETGIETELQRHDAIWLISEQPVQSGAYRAELQYSVGKLQLWKLRKIP